MSPDNHSGKATVPGFLKNMGQVQARSELIEKSLGVPFAEFDQTWQDWIEADT